MIIDTRSGHYALFRIINFIQFRIVPGGGRRDVSSRRRAMPRRNFRDCFETKVNLIYRLIIARAKFRIKLVIGFRLIRRNCVGPRRTWPATHFPLLIRAMCTRVRVLRTRVLVYFARSCNLVSFV